ncbi:MAG: hypothetical protein Q7S68_00630 [Deltaproteobacteria bacterium]|nr:hypothetical protein [Deltaproteobacteria bacterium]
MRVNVFKRFAQFGAVAREKVKNDLKEVAYFVKLGFLKKAYKNRRVFYELTEKSLAVLDHLRLNLLEEAKLRLSLYPQRKKFYEALLNDVRFLDTTKDESKEFQFLGDWRLTMTPTKSQLRLSQFRFYQSQGLAV